jgi:acyl-CoA thioester hydrolase
MQSITYKGVVYPWHCDHVGHMNVMWYTGKFDEATWNLFVELGITPSYLRNDHRGMTADQQNTQYRQELMAGDVIEIRSLVLEIRDKVIRFQHEMRNVETNAVVAVTELTAVHMDRNSRKSSSLPTAIRAEAVARLRA